MAKIRLNVDDLNVETFSVLPDRANGDGTVQGHIFGDQVGYDSVNNPSCLGTCATCPGGVTCTSAARSSARTIGWTTVSSDRSGVDLLHRIVVVLAATELAGGVVPPAHQVAEPQRAVVPARRSNAAHM